MPLHRQSPPTALAVTPNALADHLRLPQSAPETDQTNELTTLIRAATTAIERRIDGALIAQDWLWRTIAWNNPVPLGPVITVSSVTLVDPTGTRTPWTGWHLAKGLARPHIAPLPGSSAPTIPTGSHAEIRFTAGYGPDPEDIPEDLRHAVTLMSAHFYENREATTDPRTPLPLGVASLLAPHRPIRL